MTIDAKEVQVLALLAVEEPDAAATYRHICRWYSKTFSTSLEVVENDLLQLEVLRHYYESHYSDMKNDQSSEGQIRWVELRHSLLKDEKDAAVEEAREQEDDDLAAQLEKEIAESEKKFAEQMAKKKVKMDPITEKAVDIVRKGEV